MDSSLHTISVVHDGDTAACGGDINFLIPNRKRPGRIYKERDEKKMWSLGAPLLYTLPVMSCFVGESCIVIRLTQSRAFSPFSYTTDGNDLGPCHSSGCAPSRVALKIEGIEYPHPRFRAHLSFSTRTNGSFSPNSARNPHHYFYFSRIHEP